MSHRMIFCFVSFVLFCNCLRSVYGASPFEGKDGRNALESPEMPRPPLGRQFPPGAPAQFEGVNGGFLEEKIPKNPFRDDGSFGGPNSFERPPPRGYRSYLKHLRNRLRRSRGMGSGYPVMTEVVIIRKIPIMLSKLVVLATADKGIGDKKTIKNDKDEDEVIDPMNKRNIMSKVKSEDKNGDDDDKQKDDNEELELQRDEPKNKGQNDEIMNDKKGYDNKKDKQSQVEQTKIRNSKSDNPENDL